MKTLRKKKQSEEQYQSAVQEAFWASISRLDYNAARDLVTKIHDADVQLNAYRKLRLMCVNLGNIDWVLEIAPFTGEALTVMDYFNCARAAVEVLNIESFVDCVEQLSIQEPDHKRVLVEWVERMLNQSRNQIRETYGEEVFTALQHVRGFDYTEPDSSYWLKRVVIAYNTKSKGLPLDLRVVLLSSNALPAGLRDLRE